MLLLLYNYIIVKQLNRIYYFIVLIYNESMCTHDWTVCITLLDVSFKFFKKLPAPPRIWESRPKLGTDDGTCLWTFKHKYYLN